jgi:DNA polymerase elongation subunit (family B)
MSSNSNFQKSRSSSLAGADQTKVKESSIEKTHISTNPKLTETLNDLLKFPLMDSGYGIYGDTNFLWYDYRLAECITCWGRFYLKKLIDIAEKQFQFKHVYHDTDSVFLTGITTKEQDKQFRNAVTQQP